MAKGGTSNPSNAWGSDQWVEPCHVSVTELKSLPTVLSTLREGVLLLPVSAILGYPGYGYPGTQNGSTSRKFPRRH
eukprot:1360505-Rhodomonas_salina.2